MLNISIRITGDVEKFITKTSRLYDKSKESVALDLIAKGFDPDSKLMGEDISKAEDPLHHGGFPAKDKPAPSA